MADRTATLTLALKLLDQGKVAEGMAVIRREIQAGGEAAQATAGALAETAVAAEEVAQAESLAADATVQLANALSAAGDTATEAGQKQAQAALGGAQAVEGVTASVEEQAAATREAGAAAVESGEDVQRSVRETGSAVQRLTDEWEEEIRAAKEAGTAFDEATAAAAIERLSSMIRSSGDSLEQQKAALEGLTDGIVEEYGDVGDAAKDAGKAQTDQGKLIEGALTKVRARLGEVDAGLREVGGAAGQGGAEATSSFLSVQASLDLLNKSVDDATTSLMETGILPKPALAELPKLIETVNIAMERTAGTSDAATQTQLANLEAVQGKLVELNEVANRQTNAAKDNTVALQDQSQAAGQLASATGQLIGVFDKQQILTTALAGKASSLASTYSLVKNQVKALDLNTIAANGSALKYGGQLAAVAVAAKLSVDAGSALASTNTENREVFEKLSAAVAKYGRDVKENLIDRANGVQAQTQNVIATLLQLEAHIDGLSTKELNERNNEVVSKLNQDLLALSISAGRGQVAAKTFYALINEGIPTMEAANAATEKGSAAVEQYQRAQAQGAPSLALWRQAVKDSGGSVEGLAREMRVLSIDLTEQQRILDLLAELKKKDAELTREQAEANEAAAEALRDLQIAQREAQDSATRAATDALLYEQAVNGSSEAVNILTRSIRSMIEASAENSVALESDASALQQRLDALDGLGASQRARIQEVIDLAKRGNELTEADRLYVEQLTKSIENGNRAVAVTKARTEATGELAQAIEVLSGSEQLEMEASARRRAALEAEVDLIREMIAQEMRRQGIRASDTAINLNAGASLEYLRMRELALQREMESGLTIVRATSAAKVEEQDERAKLSEIIEREKAATEGAATAHSSIIKILRDGKEVWTNVTEEQRKNAEKTIEVSAAHEKLETTAGTALTAMRDLSTTVPEVTGNLDALLKKAADVELQFDKMAASINRANDAAAAAAK